MADRPRDRRTGRRPAKTGPAATPADYVALAEIGAAHGVRGAARLRVFAEEAETLTDCGPLALSDGRTIEITRLETSGGKLIAWFSGIPDRTAVETLRGETLWLPRARLPEIDEDDTFYHVDLMGLAVIDAAGTVLGTVKSVQDFGAGDLIEVARPDGPSVYLPFTRACVPEVDIAGGRLVATPPDNLFDDASPEPGEAEDGPDDEAPDQDAPPEGRP